MAQNPGFSSNPQNHIVTNSSNLKFLGPLQTLSVMSQTTLRPTYSFCSRPSYLPPRILPQSEFLHSNPFFRNPTILNYSQKSSQTIWSELTSLSADIIIVKPLLIKWSTVFFHNNKLCWWGVKRNRRRWVRKESVSHIFA